MNKHHESDLNFKMITGKTVKKTKGLDLNIFNIYDLILQRYGSNNTSTNSSTKPLNFLIVQYEYLNLINQKKVNICGVDIDFSDNHWDCRNLRKPGQSKTNFQYYMNGKQNEAKLSQTMLIVMRIFTLYLLTDKTPMATGSKNVFLSCRGFLSYLSGLNIQDIKIITIEQIKDFVDQPSRQYATQEKMKTHLSYFYSFYSLVIDDIYSVPIERKIETR